MIVAAPGLSHHPADKTNKLTVSNILFRQQQTLLKALEKLEAGPSHNISHNVRTDHSKQTVSQQHVSQIRVNNPDDASLHQLWFGVAERAVASRGHPCVIRYHGDPVKLGKLAPGGADRGAVFLPQKQEDLRFPS